MVREFKDNFKILKQIIEYKKEILKQKTKISIAEIKDKLNLAESIEKIKITLLEIEIKVFSTSSKETRESFKIFQIDNFEEGVITTNGTLYQVEENELTFMELIYKEYLKSI